MTRGSNHYWCGKRKGLWYKALETLKADLPLGEAETRLNRTAFLQVTDNAARITVPNAFAGVWLERRLYGQIYNAMKGILGKDLDLLFVASPLATSA
jgi:chromosomal replication initiation ATPase DnaA